MIPSGSTIALLAGVLTIAAPERPAQVFTFGDIRFSLRLPSAYTLQAEGQPNPAFKTFGFSTPPRADGMRGMIQVSVADFRQSPDRPSLRKFADAMVGGVRRRRTDWQSSESEITLDGATAIRIEWSGAAEPSPGQPSVRMRGVMMLGVKGDAGFALHTQDSEAQADTSLKEGEDVLMSFAIEPAP